MRLYVFELDLIANADNNINLYFPIQAATNQLYDPMKWIYNYQSNNERWTSIDDYEVIVRTSDKRPYLIDTNIKFNLLNKLEYETKVKSDVVSFTACKNSRPLRLLFWEGNNAIVQYILLILIIIIMVICIICIGLFYKFIRNYKSKKH